MAARLSRLCFLAVRWKRLAPLSLSLLPLTLPLSLLNQFLRVNLWAWFSYRLIWSLGKIKSWAIGITTSSFIISSTLLCDLSICHCFRLPFSEKLLWHRHSTASSPRSLQFPLMARPSSASPHCRIWTLVRPSFFLTDELRWDFLFGSRESSVTLKLYLILSLDVLFWILA